MNKDYFVDLYCYNDWANRQVWNCAMIASDEDYFSDNTYSIGSVFAQLSHTFEVEKWWINFLATDQLIFLSDEEREQLKDRKLLRQRWNAVHKSNLAYIETLTDQELKRTVRPDFWDESQSAITVTQALAQVANHSTDHRAQTMAVLHMLGYDGVGQDYLDFLHHQ